MGQSVTWDSQSHGTVSHMDSQSHGQSVTRTVSHAQPQEFEGLVLTIESLRCKWYAEWYAETVCSNRLPNKSVMCREVKSASSSVTVNETLRDMITRRLQI